jgi:hypothetical protein
MYFIFKLLVFDIVDEVFDDGISCFLVKNKDTEERIDYRNIKKINYNIWTNGNKVTLILRAPCKFGKEVSFFPGLSWIPF